MKTAKLIFSLLLLTLVLILVFQNTESVDTRILWATVSAPRAVLLIGTGSAGFLAGFVVARLWR